MSTDVQGRALAVLNRVAQADWPDRFNLRKPFEKLLYSGSRTGFRLASERSAKQAKGPRKADPDGLFDLSFSDDQQMLVDMLEGFALEVLRPLAHDADAEASLPAELLNQALELGLTHYGVGEVHGGMAGERTTVTTALIAEALAKGDLSLAAALLVPLSAANCIRRWGSPRSRRSGCRRSSAKRGRRSPPSRSTSRVCCSTRRNWRPAPGARAVTTCFPERNAWSCAAWRPAA